MRDRDEIGLLYLLIERLSYEPASIYRAEQLGDPAWVGYSGDSERLSALIDATFFAARSGAMQKAQHEKFAARPEMPSQKPDALVMSTSDLADPAKRASVFSALNG